MIFIGFSPKALERLSVVTNSRQPALELRDAIHQYLSALSNPSRGQPAFIVMKPPDADYIEIQLTDDIVDELIQFSEV